MEFSQEQKRIAFRKLSKNIREFLFSEELSDTLITIGKKYSLLLDKVEVIESEVFLTVEGLQNASDFIPNIKTKLGVSEEIASNIGKDVNELIFVKIRSLIQNPSDETDTEKEEADKSLEKRETDTREGILAEIENDSVAHIEDTHKLLAPLSVSATQTTITEIPKPEPKKEEKKYTVDPYREPII